MSFSQERPGRYFCVLRIEHSRVYLRVQHFLCVCVCVCHSHTTLKLSFPNDVASSQQFADVFLSSHNTSPVFPELPLFFLFAFPYLYKLKISLIRLQPPLCTRRCLLKPECVKSAAEGVMSWTRVCPHFDHLLEVKCCEWEQLCYFPPLSKFLLFSDFIQHSEKYFLCTVSPLFWYSDLPISFLEAHLSWVNGTTDIMGSLCVNLVLLPFWGPVITGKTHTLNPDWMLWCSSAFLCWKITHDKMKNTQFVSLSQLYPLFPGHV